MAKKILSLLTKILWIIGFLLSLELITDVVGRIGRTSNISFFKDFHNYVILIGQNIICGFVILSFILLILALVNKKLFNNLIYVKSIDDEIVELQNQTQRQIEITEKRLNNKLKIIQDDVSNLQLDRKLFERDVQNNKRALNAHEVKLTNLIARSTHQLLRISSNTDLEHCFRDLGDEIQMLIQKLK